MICSSGSSWCSYAPKVTSRTWLTNSANPAEGLILARNGIVFTNSPMSAETRWSSRFAIGAPTT
ncbi:Uncharacterised protein [Mycobacteroides abscessus subsp. massiliense]|nr:Uncharacterised protein [Mycobacteroides abscessus subsp. massiliense]